MKNLKTEKPVSALTQMPSMAELQLFWRELSQMMERLGTEKPMDNSRPHWRDPAWVGELDDTTLGEGD